MPEQTTQSVSLYSRHNGASKEYHVYLVEIDGLFAVNYAHGKIGQALTTGTKTAKPLPYEKALKKFEALVREKKEGDSHYIEGAAGTAYQSPASTKTLFGVCPQQPTAISRAQLDVLLDDPRWGLQEKANGENRTLRCKAGAITAGNKKGFETSVPLGWTTEFATIGDFVANGEHVGDKFFAFDLLEIGSTDLRTLPQRERYRLLEELHTKFNGRIPSFELLTCFYETSQKRQLLQSVELQRGEGVVAKDSGAAYEDGRNRNTLKFVFRDVVTCIVLGLNTQRSVQIGLLNKDAQVIPCGNVTIPSNKNIPVIEDLIDVKYIYYNPGASLEQPVYDPDDKGPRQDVERHECTFDQILRIKPVEQEAIC